MAKLEILYAKMAAFALCASLAMAASVSDRSLNGGWKRESKLKRVLASAHLIAICQPVRNF